MSPPTTRRSSRPGLTHRGNAEEDASAEHRCLLAGFLAGDPPLRRIAQGLPPGDGIDRGSIGLNAERNVEVPDDRGRVVERTDNRTRCARVQEDVLVGDPTCGIQASHEAPRHLEHADPAFLSCRLDSAAVACEILWSPRQHVVEFDNSELVL